MCTLARVSPGTVETMAQKRGTGPYVQFGRQAALYPKAALRQYQVSGRSHRSDAKRPDRRGRGPSLCCRGDVRVSHRPMGGSPMHDAGAITPPGVPELAMALKRHCPFAVSGAPRATRQAPSHTSEVLGTLRSCGPQSTMTRVSAATDIGGRCLSRLSSCQTDSHKRKQQ